MHPKDFWINGGHFSAQPQGFYPDPVLIVAQQVAALGKITRCAPNFPVSFGVRPLTESFRSENERCSSR